MNLFFWSSKQPINNTIQNNSASSFSSQINKKKQIHSVLKPENEIKQEPLIVDQVICGSNHWAILTQDGKVYTCGNLNKHGELGHQGTPWKWNQVFFNEKKSNENKNIKIRQVSCGREHTGFVSDSGNVYTCGRNTHGELGLGDRKERRVPHQVLRFSNDKKHNFDSKTIRKISFNDRVSLFLTDDSQLFSCGYYAFNGLGKTDNTLTPEPHLLLNGVNIRRICCGPNCCVVISDSNEAYHWWYENSTTFIDTSSTANLPSPVLTAMDSIIDVQCGCQFWAALHDSGMLSIVDGPHSLPIRVSLIHPILSIAVGNTSSIDNNENDTETAIYGVTFDGQVYEYPTIVRNTHSSSTSVRFHATPTSFSVHARPRSRNRNNRGFDQHRNNNQNIIIQSGKQVPIQSYLSSSSSLSLSSSSSILFFQNERVRDISGSKNGLLMVTSNYQYHRGVKSLRECMADMFNTSIPSTTL